MGVEEDPAIHHGGEGDLQKIRASGQIEPTVRKQGEEKALVLSPFSPFSSAGALSPWNGAAHLSSPSLESLSQDAQRFVSQMMLDPGKLHPNLLL